MVCLGDFNLLIKGLVVRRVFLQKCVVGIGFARAMVGTLDEKVFLVKFIYISFSS